MDLQENRIMIFYTVKTATVNGKIARFKLVINVVIP